jgi:hypothetical protein
MQRFMMQRFMMQRFRALVAHVMFPQRSVDESKRRDDRCADVKKPPMMIDATDDCCNANHAAMPKRSLASRGTTAQSCVHLHILRIGR